jgi:ribosomal-protein-alanine N-acetyltransferase
VCRHAADSAINLVNTLRCRPLTHADLNQILALDHLCFQGFWSQSAYQRELDSPNSDLLGLEVIPPQQVPEIIGMGCTWAILDEAHITLLSVAPDYQGLGFGQWLLIHLLQVACDRQLTHATLEVRKSNQRAISLYTKFGFQVAGTRPQYYADNEDALILWKSGLQTPAFAATLTQLAHQQQVVLQGQGWHLSVPDDGGAPPRHPRPQEKIKRKQ